ncbi:MAG: cobyrinic acid a,c-diamide synthase [Spirulinaceae cyanobacterium SM2_1_0]|nr:cobyrinic acid a,c-diamide synthase [Spirulinaceae cyanobacterium SM2_1_0]
MLEKLPKPAKQWAESLHWQERRFLLSLCHLLCAAPPEYQANFLDQYTADGLIAKILQDYDTQAKVQQYLKAFHIQTELTQDILRRYIKQFYVHSAQDVRREPEKYLESALRLVTSPEEKNYVLNYILGFELIELMFQMSWLQHERLYSLQNNQEEFWNTYIKPIQYAHRLNGIIQPRDERLFFARRSHFVQTPRIPEKKLIELVMVTFTTDMVSNLGFSLVRGIRSVPFDYNFVYRPEEENILFAAY